MTSATSDYSNGLTATYVFYQPVPECQESCVLLAPAIIPIQNQRLTFSDFPNRQLCNVPTQHGLAGVHPKRCLYFIFSLCVSTLAQWCSGIKALATSPRNQQSLPKAPSSNPPFDNCYAGTYPPEARYQSPSPPLLRIRKNPLH